MKGIFSSAKLSCMSVVSCVCVHSMQFPLTVVPLKRDTHYTILLQIHGTECCDVVLAVDDPKQKDSTSNPQHLPSKCQP